MLHKLLVLLLACASLAGQSQQKAWVVFSAKDTTACNPRTFFTDEALAKIHERGKTIDFYDYPVNPEYVNLIKEQGVKVLRQSDWLNAVAVNADSKTLRRIQKLPCVKKVEAINSRVEFSSISDWDTTLKSSQRELLVQQISAFEPEYFYENNIDGKGVTVAFFDAGFPNVDQSPVFNHLFENGQIKATYDFVTDKEFVYHAGSHGTSTLSCAAGILNGQKIGLAPGANYLLARTEMSVREPLSEEYNWLAAVEWAYKNGADIISSSLGYTDKRYFPYEMDGQKSFVSQAARIAVRKGILVVNSAGNEGSDDWKYIGTPADVDSVLSIGGVDPKSHLRINFSSYGPNSKQQIKPNVTAYGKVAAAGKDGMKVTYGTSFSAPLTTGFAACVWQLFPDKNNMEIMELIQQSAHLYPYYDYALGYGIPKASYFENKDNTVREDEISFSVSDSALYVSCNKTDLLPEKELNYLYCHLQNGEGYLDWYKVYDVSESKIYIADLSDIDQNDIIRIKFRNTLLTYKIQDNE